MRRSSVPVFVLALALLVLPLAGCAMDAFTPPDWGYFNVVEHPAGGIPATAGYYAGVAVWYPVGFLLSGILPAPVDETVGWGPGEVLGTTVGLVLGAPFWLIALPFGG